MIGLMSRCNKLLKYALTFGLNNLLLCLSIEINYALPTKNMIRVQSQHKNQKY